ncbi:MAG: DUF1385 domain-containing protein [Candidatus Atribacteria bacterium]|nr:DUF1385 domain-containing protein [Candidatus Atribacteria bacterium]
MWTSVEQKIKPEKNERHNVGGQAIIEGVMMRSPWKISIAVRKPNGIIVTDIKEKPILSKTNKFFALPIVRGVVNMVDSLIIGLKALSLSATLAMDEEEEKLSVFDLSIAMLLAFGLFVGLFIALPTFLTSRIDHYIHSNILYNIIEGLIRVTIFLLYLYVISRMKDIKRIFEYHGAEHKTIFAFENGQELTLENIRKYTTHHPRCGTNWLMIVMIISIFVFSFLGRPGIGMRIISRVVLIPIVAGLAYEAIRLLSKYQDRSLASLLALPGLLLQRITTQEPDDSQLEVAVVALKGSLKEECEYVAK